MDVRLLLASCIIASVSRVSEAYGNGAPATSCVDQRPGHGSAQTSMSAYSIVVADGTVTKYTPGTPISVTITGGNYQGFLLQARLADGSTTVPVGTWSDPPSNTRLAACSTNGDSMTHSSTSTKNAAVFTWNPPNQDVGNVKFLATVAQSKYTWWLNHESIELSYSSTPDPNSTEPAPGSSSVITQVSTMLLMGVVVAFITTRCH